MQLLLLQMFLDTPPQDTNMNMVVVVLFLLSILLPFLVILGFMVK